MEFTEKDTGKLASNGTGQGDIPLGKSALYEQLKPMKGCIFHRHTEELISDSSTNTDVELSQREKTSANPIKPNIPPPLAIVFISNNQESGNAEHSWEKDDITVIGYKTKTERKAVYSLPPCASQSPEQ